MSLAILGGCARKAARAGSLAERPQPVATTTVTVRNHHGADLRIYVVAADGSSHRLGIVPRFGAVTLGLPHVIQLPAELRFVAMPLSHDEPQVTGGVLVDAGAGLVFTVEADASVSTLTRRPPQKPRS